MVKTIFIFVSLVFTGSLAIADAPTCTDLMSKTECQMWSAINRVRVQNKIPRLKLNPRCSQASDYHAKQMVNEGFFSHDGLKESWSSRMQRFHLRGKAVGENIAWGNGVEGTVSSWMKSPGHRRNILQTKYKSTGIGLAVRGDGRPYWVQCFSAQLDY